MKRIYLAAFCFLCAAGAAQAQQPAQPAFVPYTIGAREHEMLMKWLGEQPGKFSTPLINQLNEWESQAQKKAREEAEKKPAAEQPKKDKEKKGQ